MGEAKRGKVFFFRVTVADPERLEPALREVKVWNNKKRSCCWAFRFCLGGGVDGGGRQG